MSSPLHHADARERLILAHVPLLKHIVGRMIAPSGFDRDDLYGFGMLGLISAADAWEPERGLKFSTYAYTRIRGAILDELRRCDRLSRGAREQLRDVERAIARLEQEHGTAPSIEDVARALGSTVSEVEEALVAGRSGLESSLDEEQGEAGALASLLGDPKSEDPVGSAEWGEAKARLADAIEKLSEQEQSVITLYYAEGLLLREIGQVLGVTESRVSQIHSRAIYELNRLLGAPERAGRA
jgi:RNA polymerase sigma factor FliA